MALMVACRHRPSLLFSLFFVARLVDLPSSLPPESPRKHHTADLAFRGLLDCAAPVSLSSCRSHPPARRRWGSRPRGPGSTQSSWRTTDPCCRRTLSRVACWLLCRRSVAWYSRTVAAGLPLVDAQSRCCTRPPRSSACRNPCSLFSTSSA